MYSYVCVHDVILSLHLMYLAILSDIIIVFTVCDIIIIDRYDLICLCMQISYIPIYLVISVSESEIVCIYVISVCVSDVIYMYVYLMSYDVSVYLLLYVSVYLMSYMSVYLMLYMSVYLMSYMSV